MILKQKKILKMNLIQQMDNFQGEEHSELLKNVKVKLIKNDMQLKPQNNKKDKPNFQKL